MKASLAEYVFPEPWWDLRGRTPRETSRRGALMHELRVELSLEHVASSGDVIAAFTRQDEVLLQLPDESFVFVHLTWTGRSDRHVQVRPFANWGAAREELETMSRDW